MAENTSADGSITWASFKKHTEAFHVLSNQQHLQVDIHLPPSLEAGKSHPLIITYHGGGLIGGDRGGYEYMSPWLPAYAAEANAIIVSPDHRLLPKASGRDVRDDLDALWKWVNSSLNSIVGQIAPEHTADLSRILVQGESAGGFCAAHLALSYPDKIRAAMLGYPMVGGFHEQGLVKQKMFPPELLPSKEELASWIKQQNALENWPLVRNDDTNFLIGLFQDQAAYLEAFGSDKDISPTYRAAEGGDATGIPERVWILHGVDDSLVPVRYSQELFEILKGRGWSSKVRLTIIDEGVSEHGFDHTWSYKDDRLTKHLSWINESWLK